MWHPVFTFTTGGGVAPAPGHGGGFPARTTFAEAVPPPMDLRLAITEDDDVLQCRIETLPGRKALLRRRANIMTTLL